jgi:hypothetical protein
MFYISKFITITFRSLRKSIWKFFFAWYTFRSANLESAKFIPIFKVGADNKNMYK